MKYFKCDTSTFIYTNSLNSGNFKSKKALFALRAISKYFNFNEMISLLDSNFYSILYYKCSIWLNSFLNPEFKQKLLSISANALRPSLKNTAFDVSFTDIHKISKKCTPSQIMLYNQAIRPAVVA